MILLKSILLAAAVATSAVAAEVAAPPLELHTRSRPAVGPEGKDYRVVDRTMRWAPRKTAIIICDMWDQHWCQGATRRVAEMAPRMNEVLKEARRRGVLIIHAPSDTMAFYATYPQRKRALEAPKAQAPPEVEKWRSLNLTKEGPLPIDDSDGGCDDQPQCRQGGPWKRQIATLEILPEDVISDRGDEVYNILQQLGIENVIIMGVHTNMCVLGRPFSIRQMVSLGKHVLLMRDMTDTMYNSRMRPFVSHFVGTDLVVEHIEKHWCPTITSTDFLGGQPFRFAADHRKTVAFLIGENEYKTWETLPRFAAQELAWRGYQTVWVTSSTSPNDPEFKNYEAIKDADLLLVSARRRTPRREMLDLIRRHLDSGKALVGIRTASHAFAGKLASEGRTGGASEFSVWPEFDAQVLGGNYTGHHAGSAKTRLQVPAGMEGNPILTGVNLAELEGNGTLYKTGPLKPAAKAILLGAIPGQPPESAAWTHPFGPNQARVFYTSLGHPADFENPQFTRLLLNSILWALNDPIPPAR